MSRARDLADLGGSADAGGITGKNLIINGAMQVAQRGTSFTGITDQYTLDRWTSSSAGGVSLNVSQQTATSSDNAYFASKHFARYQRNAVLSGFVHKVENLQQFNNKTFTLSFWAKSSDAGTNIALNTYTMNDGSSFNNYVTRTYVTNPTLSSTWQKYEMRLTFQDMYSYGYSGSHHLRLQFFDGANAATFDIAEVQLEVGEQATPFEHRSFGDELARCQRYFQIIPSNSAAYSFPLVRHRSATNSYSGSSYYPVTMRTNATMTLDTSGSWIHKPNTRQDTGSATVVSSSSSVFTVVAVPSTNDSTQYLAFSNNNVEADAEL